MSGRFGRGADDEIVIGIRSLYEKSAFQRKMEVFSLSCFSTSAPDLLDPSGAASNSSPPSLMSVSTGNNSRSKRKKKKRKGGDDEDWTEISLTPLRPAYKSTWAGNAEEAR